MNDQINAVDINDQVKTLGLFTGVGALTGVGFVSGIGAGLAGAITLASSFFLAVSEQSINTIVKTVSMSGGISVAFAAVAATSLGIANASFRDTVNRHDFSKNSIQVAAFLGFTGGFLASGPTSYNLMKSLVSHSHLEEILNTGTFQLEGDCENSLELTRSDDGGYQMQLPDGCKLVSPHPKALK